MHIILTVLFLVSLIIVVSTIMSSKPSLVYHETEKFCTKYKGVLNFLREGHMHGKTAVWPEMPHFKSQLGNLFNFLIYKNVINSKISVKDVMHINTTFFFFANSI